MTTYRIGTGIAEVTDSASGTAMQGMADPGQKVTGVESRLFARAFVIASDTTDTFVTIVNADIWAGTAAVKSEVVRRLKVDHPGVFDEDNVLISGTHTHSAPGGYSDHRLYEHTGGGFDPHTFECIVHGMVTAVRKAHRNLVPGRIYINTGAVADCGRQRSREAYLNNPQAERDRYGTDTDTDMLLLKFVAEDNGVERPLGVLNWYAIHPTDRGQKNTLLSGDNKGHASWLFETAMGTDPAAGKTFVAAFANSSCGDVSGNVEFGAIPDGRQDKAHMEMHGRKQYDAASQLFSTAREALKGTVDYRHTRVDMSNVAIEGQRGTRTWPGALGLSFAAGSTEDSVPILAAIMGQRIPSLPVPEGLVEGEPPVTDLVFQPVRGLMTAGLAVTFGSPAATPPGFAEGQAPKPLILAPGLLDPPITPNVLPLQILKIGNLAVVAIPGEITTMAGRRLRETVLDELKDAGVDRVALATYANDYSQYICTKEEYDTQHYEGASTLFGPYTLVAYQQEFRRLASAVKNGSRVAEGPRAPGRSAPTAKRVTFRNASGATVTLKLFKQSDKVAGGALKFMAVPFETLTVPANSDRACCLPGDVDEAKARINDSKTVEHITQHTLVVIAADGVGSVTTYDPPYAPHRSREART
jgi:neutral ceramidase